MDENRTRIFKKFYHCWKNWVVISLIENEESGDFQFETTYLGRSCKGQNIKTGFKLNENLGYDRVAKNKQFREKIRSIDILKGIFQDAAGDTTEIKTDSASMDEDEKTGNNIINMMITFLP